MQLRPPRSTRRCATRWCAVVSERAERWRALSSRMSDGPIQVTPNGRPRRIKEMRPDDIASALKVDTRLIVPIGTCEQHGPHMPLGADTIIVERLADDLSSEFGVLRAPTLEYGVNIVTERGFAGNASLRRKTLHRALNDLLDTWESTGVTEVIRLTPPEPD